METFFLCFHFNQQAQLQVSPQQQQQLMGKQTSMNPEINALMTSIIHSANQLQQQSGQYTHTHTFRKETNKFPFSVKIRL